MSFNEKVVIVTGSSSGIGAATAVEFTKEGANVVIVGRKEVKLNDVRVHCAKYGRKPYVLKLDISKDADAKKIVDATVEKFGKIDVLVNNAGIFESTDILSENFMEDYDRIVNTNLRSMVFITHLAVPHLIKSKGNIVNISSVAGFSTIGFPDIIPYCISKAGVNHFTKCAALKLSSYGVRVNAVCPGPVRTNILDNPTMQHVSWEIAAENTVLKRVSEPQEIAEVILFLASAKAKGITGSNFVSDNGVLIKQ